MKKKIIITASALVLVALVSVGTYMHSTSITPESASQEASLGASGKHCTGTVGCDCSGFSPITNGKEYQKSYCKRCGHHKKYHK